MPSFRSLSRLLKRQLKGQRVIVRLDLNLPTDANGNVGANERYRLDAALPTLSSVREEGAIVVIMSHRGRPDGKIVPALSLEPFAKLLSTSLRHEVSFVADPFLPANRARVADAKPGDVFLFENLRFFPGEDENDSRFGRELAKFGNYFVNEAFAVSHRAAASVAGIPKHLPSYAGLNLQKEIAALRRAAERPRRPAVALLGGAKISTKIKLVKKLARKFDAILLGGGLANTCLAACGQRIGQSLVEKEMKEDAAALCSNKKIVLPQDYRVVPGKEKKPLAGTAIERLPNDIRPMEYIGDIGPETERVFLQECAGAKTVVWNGPLGNFEDQRFRLGTAALLASLLSDPSRDVIVGGGETVQAVMATLGGKAVPPHVFLSTGGGAMIEFLEGKKLPGIRALEVN